MKKTASWAQPSLLLLLAAAVVCVGPLAGAPTKKSKTQKARFKWVSRVRPAVVKQLKVKQDKIEQKMQAVQVQVEQKQAEQERLTDMFNQSQAELERLEGEAQVAELRRREAERQLSEATQRLKQAEQRLTQQQQRFSRRIRQGYMEGPVTYVDVVLGAKTLSDFLDRQYYAEKFMEQDSALVRTLRAAQRQVQREQLELAVKVTEERQAANELQARTQAVFTQSQAQQKLQDRILGDIAELERFYNELERESLEVEASLAAELARRERIRLSNPRAYRQLPRLGRSFARPVHGVMTSPFGYRMHPVLRYRRLHTGIDYGAVTGTPVYAAGGGEVFHAGLRGGYGKCIIILHGGGIQTLYGHLSRIAVNPGQAVKRGQYIGNVGSTGLSTGPHLHFEVRRHGVPVNPLSP